MHCACRPRTCSSFLCVVLRLCAGTVIRSLTTQAPYAEILAHTGQIINAAAGPLVMATPSKLSEQWFPPHQRNIATAIGVMSNFVGSGVGFLVALPVTTPNRIAYMLW